MANYPETVRELYPADTRWGNGYVKPPLWGKVTAAFEAELDQQRAGIRETIAFFEDKYPAFHWWETNFVEIKPASSLLMQSVNQIGRASCRERVWISVVAEAVRKEKG